MLGLQFKNPVGLGAGFDKNALYLREIEVMGFGFVEVGTVTPEPQAGNLKPRLFRIMKDKALVNRMGFNNDGVKAVARRLKDWRERRDVSRGELTDYSSANSIGGSLLIGGNIGKNKSTPNEEAWKDYEICFLALHAHVDFFVINVSSPNTPGLRELQEKEALRKIITHLQSLNKTSLQQKPILLKIAPDLSFEQLDDVIALTEEIKLEGLVVTNTTTGREGLKTVSKQIEQIGHGGLSGRPLEKKSTEIIKYIHQKTRGSVPLIGCGGIFTGEDALSKLNAGASLLEVWTGLIYEGPFIVKHICKSLNR